MTIKQIDVRTGEETTLPGDAPSFPKPVLTAEEKDAVAAGVADEFIDRDLAMKALGLVMADLVEATFNVSQAVARNQVKTRFRDYYRALLDQ